jgi:gluconolactonase
LLLILVAGVSGCNNNTANPLAMADDKVYDTIGVTVEWYIDKDSSLPDKSAVAKVIAQGYNWSEGPVWIDGMDMLLFSDVPENKICKWIDSHQ